MDETTSVNPDDKPKICPKCRLLMSLIGLLASREILVPEGHISMRPFQWDLKEHWKFPQLLAKLLPWAEFMSINLKWWLNPLNVLKGAELHQSEHNILLFTDALNEVWGAHLGQDDNTSRPRIQTPHQHTGTDNSVPSNETFPSSVATSVDLCSHRQH